MTITTDPSTTAKVNVAVRVRPFNKREIDLHTTCVVDMRDSQTILQPPPVIGKQNDKKQTKTFAFDHCFWSMDSTQDKFASQEEVFEKLGSNLLENVFTGYNACIFAYGQTGSGKSYTMMGSRDQPGLIPRLCTALFDRIGELTNELHSYKVEVSYMEIYNEKVRDLLDPNGGRSNLSVREHKSLGTYVDGLQLLATSSALDIEELMSEGNKSRTVAATKMNAESSRSHAVFTLKVTQTLIDKQSGVSGERVSKVSLVDLAGSERASKTGASGARLKEGSNINKSLTTLGLVISALADQASGKSKGKFVPYRDSVLTWILKDNLGGNSRTAMIATISPSADNYEETLSTLRYADRAKRIVNKAVVNEDPNAKIIRELREEVEKLQQQLKQSESMRAPELKDKLEQSEKLIKEISTTWEEKLRKTEEVHKKRQETLENMGISLEASGIKVQKTKCFLVNLNADPSLNELLVYYLKPNTSVGQSETCDMQLSGLGIMSHHADIEVTQTHNVFITPMESAKTCINGRPITNRTSLRHGDRVLWGNNHFFRINLPRSIPRLIKLKDNESNGGSNSVSDGESEHNISQETDQSLNESNMDYEFAQREVLMNEAEAPMQETILSLEREFQQLHGSTHDPVPLDDSERQKYEMEIETLRKQLLTFSPRGSHDSLDKISSKEPSDVKEPSNHLVVPSEDAEGNIHDQYRTWRIEREDAFRASLQRLQQNLMHSQALAREANSLSTEMNKQTEFVVTLQIPAHNLTANRRRNALLCEPAIQVIRQGRDCQIWSVEKLENRLIDMRELYLEHQSNNVQNMTDLSFTTTPSIEQRIDPFNETERNQILIGVSNVFLSCLLTDVPLRYPVPIINQQGQVSGKLVIEMQRISGSIPDRMLCEDMSDSASDTTHSLSDSSMSSTDVTHTICTDVPSTDPHAQDNFSPSTSDIHGKSTNGQHKHNHKSYPEITCRLTIVEAQGLPSTLSHFVQCQYMFLDCPDVILVPPDLSPDAVSPKSSRSTMNIKFNHTMQFTCNVTEELVDRITSGSSLAIELWGHRDRYNQGNRVRGQGSTKSRDDSRSNRFRSSSILSEKNKTLKERWSEVIKRVQLDVNILEINDAGEYEPVQIQSKPDIASVGIFQLKQGQSRRMHVALKMVENSGTLPLLCDRIVSVYAGSISATPAGKEVSMDSYQDIDLNELRTTWLDTLTKRKEHLDKQMSLAASSEAKTELEKERESHLMDQYVTLTEERNAVFAPMPNSGIPGAPAHWVPPSSVEMHVPHIFLNIDASDESDDLIMDPRGLESYLPNEDPGSFVQLPVIRHEEGEMDTSIGAMVSWDSSVHDSLYLNRVTQSNERVYVIIKVHVLLSHPIEMDIVLRKRICVNIYKQKGFTASLIRKMQGKAASTSGVIYEIVSNIPLSSRDSEDRESMAIMAASGAKFQTQIGDSGSNSETEFDGDDINRSRGQTPFEQYVTRAMRSVDDILYLDKMRQQVALRECANAMRKLTGDESKYITKKLTAGRARSISGFSTMSKLTTTNKKRMSTTPVHQTRHFVESFDNKTGDIR